MYQAFSMICSTYDGIMYTYPSHICRNLLNKNHSLLSPQLMQRDIIFSGKLFQHCLYGQKKLFHEAVLTYFYDKPFNQDRRLDIYTGKMPEKTVGRIQTDTKPPGHGQLWWKNVIILWKLLQFSFTNRTIKQNKICSAFIQITIKVKSCTNA